ncbi:protein disulfide oxidoreductase [Campylobacter pinnipediorum subsp. caledonicus]|uniref:Thiol:disulfide interchange protein DsbA n=1 Tax=Campylobacter pinnipediorum subsp. caledonicus TaxID=1874362 RepID=A0A1S6U8J4_9BACT|nr:thiol:disulfide interchange protein DsbA/DsbL [Campylobacter pinnipediorum]AQW88020.1 protein disulfide oxidoreductase [Campylobacter pinnipediorum subsp. caledonicus]OPA71466.1 thiol:disulfide interchange protein [Campylobacter pinnipediorum subsp. caledonicus]
MRSLFLKTVKFLSVVALFGALSANAFTEGEDYVKLEQPLPVENNTLVKVFSYACPHCYKYDKSVVSKLMQKLPGIKFVPYHLKTKGSFGETISKVFAVLIAKDNENGISLLDDKSLFKKAKFAYYRAYHDKKETWNDGKDKDGFLKTGLDAVGMSVDDYNKELNNPKVIEILSKWDAAYDVAKLQGVPAFVVNGKYLINIDNVKSIEGIARLVKDLLAK